MGFIAAAVGVSAASSIIGGIMGASSAKKQAKAQKEAAKLQKEASIAEAGMTQKFTTEKTGLELRQTTEQVGIGTQQSKDKLDLDFTQKTTAANLQASQQTGDLELQARQAEGAAKRTAFQIEAAVFQNRSLSTIKQANAANAAALAEGKARARAAGSGVVTEGSAEAVIQQETVLAELDRIQGAYETELTNRGLLIEKGMALAKATETRLAVEFNKKQINDMLGMDIFQATQSRAVGISQVYQNSEFSIRATQEAAAMTVEQANQAAALQKKYAEISAKFKTDAAKAQYRDTLTSIAINVPLQIVGAAASGGVSYGAQNPGAFSNLFGTA